ncbi:MAG: hypothetical protein HKL84_08470 [Acidimicrobiaceae bacterium]|nr:hypothetical protein [Acidimicrobiaceae bacterium]
MKIFDTLLGRSQPAKSNLDNLFSLPGASITLSVSGNLVTTGKAGVCFKPASGASFENAISEFQTVIETMGTKEPAPNATDSYGYEWITLVDADFELLVTKTHMLNSTIDEAGYGSQLLCSVFPFRETETGEIVNFVYLFKRGSFYPFIPTGTEKRNSEREMAVKALIEKEIPIESDLAHWFPLWEIPLK